MVERFYGQPRFHFVFVHISFFFFKEKKRLSDCAICVSTADRHWTNSSDITYRHSKFQFPNVECLSTYILQTSAVRFGLGFSARMRAHTHITCSALNDFALGARCCHSPFYHVPWARFDSNRIESIVCWYVFRHIVWRGAWRWRINDVGQRQRVLNIAECDFSSAWFFNHRKRTHSLRASALLKFLIDSQHCEKKLPKKPKK